MRPFYLLVSYHPAEHEGEWSPVHFPPIGTDYDLGPHEEDWPYIKDSPSHLEEILEENDIRYRTIHREMLERVNRASMDEAFQIWYFQNGDYMPVSPEHRGLIEV